MRWAATQQTGETIQEVLQTCWDFVGLHAPDFVMVSVRSPEDPVAVMSKVLAFLQVTAVRTVVCGIEETANGHSEHSIEISLTCALLPDVDINLHSIESMFDFRTNDACKGWIGVEPELQPVFLGFPAMACNDVTSLFTQLDKTYPDAPKVAGRFALAFGIEHGRYERPTGMQGGVLVSFCGDIEADVLVAQGARAVGAPLVVTRCRENKILELDGRPALRVMQAVYDTMKSEEKSLFQSQPLCGLGIMDARGRVGGYRIGRITGVHRDSGMFAVPHAVSNHDTVQFFIRGPSIVADELSVGFSESTLMKRTRGAIVLKSNWTHSLGPFGSRPMCTGIIDAKTAYGPIAGQTFPLADAAVYLLFKKRDWS